MSKQSRRFFRAFVAFALMLILGIGSLAMAASQDSDGVIISQEDYELLLQYKHLEQMRQIILNYYYEDVDEEDLMSGAAQGMFYSLGDPYSFYYTKESMDKFRESASGEYRGVGIQVLSNAEDFTVSIVRVFRNSPAERAGLRAGDKIIQVDDLEVTAYEVNDAVTIMKSGVAGSTVEIKVLRGEEILDFTVERGEILINNSEFEMLEGNIAYIQLYSFEASVVQEYLDALKTLRSQGAVGLILDLRDNPGGMVDYAEKIANTFLRDQMLYYREDRFGLRLDTYADGQDLGMPLVILCNGNSASASEIIIGAVQAAEVGTIVGETTFGKGIIQMVQEFPEGDGMQVTIAQYFTPDGRNIHGIGIEPDVQVVFNEEAYNDIGGRIRQGDNQLQTAMEVIQELLEKEEDKAA